MKAIGQWILDLLYPPKCCLCCALLSPEERSICRQCYESRGIILEQYCRKCGKQRNEDEIICWDCRHKKHEFEQGYGLFPYSEIKDAILLMKYHHQRWRAIEFAKLMAWIYEAEIRSWQIDAIAFVPQNIWSQGEKGYNPAQAVAKKLSEIWEIPLLKKGLRAHYKYQSQKSLTGKERAENLREVFYYQGKMTAKNILLVDDVYTTGATIDACCHVLRQSGAEKVYFLTMAIGSRQG